MSRIANHPRAQQFPKLVAFLESSPLPGPVALAALKAASADLGDAPAAVATTPIQSGSAGESWTNNDPARQGFDTLDSSELFKRRSQEVAEFRHGRDAATEPAPEPRNALPDPDEVYRRRAGGAA